MGKWVRLQSKMIEIQELYKPSRQLKWIGEEIEGYKVPCTVLSGDCIAYSGGKENQRAAQSTTEIAKRKFGMAKRESSWLKGSKNPSPAQYRPQSPESKPIPSSFFRLPKNKKVSKGKDKVGVGCYNIDISKPTGTKNTLNKEIKRGFIDQAQSLNALNPGPGVYNPKRQRHHSLTILSKVPKPNGYCKTDKKGDKSGLGPWSYQVARSKSVSCTVKYLPRHTASEEFIKINGVAQKSRPSKTGPGSYLKIEDWCRYRDDRKAATTLTITSKGRTPSVYH